MLLPVVVASKPFTSTCDPAPNKTPLGLSMTIFPLASRWPKIWLGLALLIRLSTTAEDDGWINCVVSPFAMVKLLQSITALFVDWAISTVLPEVVIVADPAETTPPAGFASAAVIARIVDKAVVDKKLATRKKLFPRKTPTDAFNLSSTKTPDLNIRISISYKVFIKYFVIFPIHAPVCLGIYHCMS